jgi:predicted RNase H-like nuclease (RuvC/YqgF family)
VLIKQLTGFGKTMILSTDKKNIPQYLKRIGVKIGAKIIHPKQDLSLVEKRGLVRIHLKNDHEKDAAAAAFFAYKKSVPLIQKVKKAVISNEVITEKVLRSVLRGTPISEAISDLFIAPRERIITKEIVKEKSDKNHLKLLNKIKDYEKIIKILRDSKEDLKKPVKKVFMKNTELLEHREKHIKEYSYEIKRLKKTNERLKGDIRKILRLDDYILVKKINTFLDLEERPRYIFPNNISLFTSKNVSKIKKDVRYVICDKASQILKDNFITIPLSKLRVLLETEEYFLVDKDSRGLKKNLIETVINDYKKQRSG